MALKNAVGGRIKAYCVLDSDYRSEDEIRARYEDAEKRGVSLHVWSRKEIENFLLRPSAIRRLLAARISGRNAPNESEVHEKMIAICEGERSSVEDGVASALVQADRRLDVGTANKAARSRVGELWGSTQNRLALVSGKDLLARISEWTQGEFGASFGAPAIARQMKASDIADEVREVIGAIETGSPFPLFQDRLDRFALRPSPDKPTASGSRRR
jgi:hypothetical protein